MKKIVFIINSLMLGGVEKCLVNLVNQLDKSKYDITVISLIKDYQIKSQLNEDIRVIGIFPKWMKGIDYIFKYIHPNILYKYIVKDNYDIEIAYSDGKAVKLLGLSDNPSSIKKRLTWIHQDVGKWKVVNNAYKSWDEYRESYKGFNKVICISQLTKYNFEKISGVNNTELVYNLVSSKFIQEQSKEDIYIKDNEFKLICVGRLSKEKGQLRLIKIHKKLLNEGLHHKLLIIGDGPDREKIEEYIRENKLENSVKLLGFQSNPYKYMSKCDLYVCPSYTEALSTTCIESLFLDLPVITTDCPGMKDIFCDSEYGIIVQNNDEDLYLGIKEVLDNKDIIKKYKNKIKNRKNIFEDKYLIKKIESIMN